MAAMMGTEFIIFSLILVSVIILIGFFGGLVFKKTGIPDIIWLLLFGLVVGVFISPELKGQFLLVSSFFATIAIIVILFDGGINMDLYKLLKGAPRGLVLAMCSFLLSILAVTIIMTILGAPLLHGILLGVIIGGTSSPIVIPIATKLGNLKDQTKIMLSIESVITDVLCIVVAIAIIYTLTFPGGADPTLAFKSIITTFSIGAVVGLAAGFAWLPVMHRIRKVQFSYVVTLAITVLLYCGVILLVGEVGGSGAGAIACLLFGIVLGNGKKIFQMMHYKEITFEIDETTKRFHALITFFVRTFFFVYLGLIITVTNLEFVLVGIVVTMAILSLRPIAIMASTWRGSFEKSDKQTMTLLLPRGLAAAVLAYLPIQYGIPHTAGFAEIAFTVILGTAIISTIGVSVIGYHEGKKEKKEQIVEEAKKAQTKPVKTPKVKRTREIKV
jgi:cell volume regulation protein A